MLSNLIVRYCSPNKHENKEDVLQVLANLLNFDFDQRLEVGLIQRENYYSPLSLISKVVKIGSGTSSPTPNPNLRKPTNEEVSQI